MVFDSVMRKFRGRTFNRGSPAGNGMQIVSFFVRSKLAACSDLQRPTIPIQRHKLEIDMKVTELKKRIGDYKSAQLRVLLVEMYKAMPKRVKADYGIDDLICNPGAKQNNGNNGLVAGIEALASQTEQFVSRAY